MDLLYHICIGLSAGVVIGFLLGGLRYAWRKGYSEKQVKEAKRFLDKIALVLKYVTFLFLALGFVWCAYFLILGAAVPARADYASNMAQLIVSVLTVISIVFAFAEFLRRADGKKE